MVAAAGTAAMAATADAATLTIAPVKACYLTGEAITAAGAGFTPNGAFEVKLDGTSLGQRDARPDGTFAVTITLGTMRAVKSHALSATDVTDPALTAGASFMGTQNIVTVKPKDAKAGDKLRIRGYGFLAGPRVYMHVRGHGYSTDKRVGNAAAPCGTFATRKRIIPATATPGFYRVQFDARRRYSKKTKPRVKGRMHVFRRFSATSARASAFAGVSVSQSWTRVSG